jgi:hypothetical protein
MQGGKLATLLPMETEAWTKTRVWSKPALNKVLNKIRNPKNRKPKSSNR